MKRLTLLILLNLIVNLLHAQAPQVKLWDMRYGGLTSEVLTSIIQTKDSGFLLGGFSTSGIGGDKTQINVGGNDYWIVKLNAQGEMQWNKNYGGTGDDLLYSVSATADGGYILGGTSYSDSSGDKTQPLVGNNDYWIVKVDSAGNYQWDKTFGGTDIDNLYKVQQTFDGGYILGGYSYSGISGDKTQPSLGQKDYWVIKTDTVGNKLWDYDFGGVGDDWMRDLEQSADSGFIVGGFSNSNVSGDKTQPSWGGYDFWIIKLNSQGNKQWDKDFGGTSIDGLFTLKQTADKGYILAGNSNSGIGGDKTDSAWGAYDYWIVKTDEQGIKQWDKDIGGLQNEEIFGSVIQTVDMGYLIAGISYSSIGGNKTENNLGFEQSWVIKTDSLGVIQWDKTILTTGHDETGLALQTYDSCIVVANFSSAGIGGYKSQPAWNNIDDFWIIKFCDSSQIAGITQLSNPEFKVAVYPNPFTNILTLNFQKLKPLNSNGASLMLTDVLGKIIYKANVDLSNYKQTFDLNFLESGIYFLQLKTTQTNHVVKIVKQ